MDRRFGDEASLEAAKAKVAAISDAFKQAITNDLIPVEYRRNLFLAHSLPGRYPLVGVFEEVGGRDDCGFYGGHLETRFKTRFDGEDIVAIHRGRELYVDYGNIAEPLFEVPQRPLLSGTLILPYGTEMDIILVRNGSTLVPPPEDKVVGRRRLTLDMEGAVNLDGWKRVAGAIFHIPSRTRKYSS